MVYDPPGPLELHQVAWITAGITTFFACIISFWTIYKHLRHYNEVRLQRYIVRILLMVPVSLLKLNCQDLRCGFLPLSFI
jgi:hypothetical protein